MPAIDELNSPLRLPCGTVFPNRLANAAMTEGLSRDGNPNIEHERLYRARSRCGAGLLLTGNVQIDRRHLERPGNVVLDREPHAQAARAFRRWANVAKEGGAKVFMQIRHAGRQTPARVNAHPSAPTAVPLAIAGCFGTPIEMPESGIENVIARPLCAELDGLKKILPGELRTFARFEDTIIAHLGEVGERPGRAGELPEGFAVIAWFYQQLRRIGKGQAPDAALDVVKAFLDERRDDASLAGNL